MSVRTQRLDFAEFYRKSKDECLFTVLVSVSDQAGARGGRGRPGWQRSGQAGSCEQREHDVMHP